MARHHIFLGFCLTLCLWSGIALAEDLAAVSFLKDIVRREFDGDIMARRTKVMFTDGKGATVGSCGCSMPREAWDLDEEFVIVNSWDVAAVHPSAAGRVTIDIVFHVVGKSVMSDDDVANRVPGRLQIISAPHKPYDEIVSYKLLHKKQGWVIANPPQPRTSIAPVSAKLAESLASYSDKVERAKKAGDLKSEKIAVAHSFFIRSQAAVLEYAGIQ